MPGLLLMLLIVFGILACIAVMGFALLEKRATLFGVILFVSFIVFPALIGWTVAAWDQEISSEEYYYIQTISNDNGTIMQVVNHEDGEQYSITSDKRKIFVSDTIVKVWRYEQWKFGVNWFNGGRRYECIPPQSSQYKDVQSKALNKRQEDCIIQIGKQGE